MTVHIHKPYIDVCGPNDDVPSGALKLCVGSWAPVMNAGEWRRLWLLSPLCALDSGVHVPGLDGVVSNTVENAWQFLKIWPDEGGWKEEEAMEAFRSRCAIRYPRGKGKQPIGFHWGKDDSILDKLAGRKRIYVPAYSEMLASPEQQEQVLRLREAARVRHLCIWDPDSYNVTRCGMKDIAEAVNYLPRPFAHAFVVALAVEGRLDVLAREWKK